MAARAQGMKAVMRAAISTAPPARLPLLLFNGRERSSSDLSVRLARLSARVDELVAELDRALEEPSFWLFVSSPKGYSLIERRGRDPKRGDVVDVDGAEYRIAVVAGSSLLDGRRCAFLEPAALALHAEAQAAARAA